MLSMRPDFEKGIMVRNEDEWTKDALEGSYRLRADWMSQRYSHVNEDGSLSLADFSSLTEAKKLSEEAELDYCKQLGLYKDESGQIAQDQELELEFEEFNEEQVEFIEAAKLSELLEMHPKDRKKDARYDILLSKAVSSCDKKDRSKFRLAKKELSRKLCAKLALRATKMRKSELMNSLTPAAACKPKVKKSKKKKKTTNQKNAKKPKKDDKDDDCSNGLKNKDLEDKGCEDADDSAVKALEYKGVEDKDDEDKGAEDKGAEDKDENAGVEDKGSEDKAAQDEAVQDKAAEPHHLIGKDVRVISASAGCFLYGKLGKHVAVREDHKVEFRIAGQVSTRILEHQWVEPAVPVQLKFPKLSAISKAMKRKMLEDASLSGEGCDAIEIIEKKQNEILSQHIELAFSFMRRQWQLEESVSFIDPKLSELCMKGIDDNLSGTEKAEYEALHQMRCRMLVEKSQPDKYQLVLCPIFSDEAPQHWTLLTIKGDEVGYYETLSQEHQGNISTAVQLLSLIRSDLSVPARINKTRQEGATCGFWVVRYMEEAVRDLIDQRGTNEWPEIVQWKMRLMSLTSSLSVEVVKIKQEEAELALKHAHVLAKAKLRAQQLQKKIENDKLCQEQKDAAQAELDKLPCLKRCFENLRPEYQLQVDIVRQNPKFICGVCRYSSGCWKCDPEKALAAYLKKEFGPEDVFEELFLCVAVFGCDDLSVLRYSFVVIHSVC